MRLMNHVSVFCSYNIIQQIFSFVNMIKTTIFSYEIWVKGRIIYFSKKIKKTIDKQIKGWYNTTEVERNF